jgi:concanavalin A-like lectin/glucanase superfamily protein
MRRLGLSLASLAVAAMVASGSARAASGTVALWHMDETSGTAMTDSATAGSVRDTGRLHNVTLGQPGSGGRAYRFNGPSLSYVDVPSSGDLNPGGNSFTFSVKVKFTVAPSSSVGDYDLLRKGLSTTSGGDYKAEIVQSGKALCQWKGSSANVQLIGGPDLDNGAWHSISCEKTSSAVRLRVDGTVRASRTVKVGTISNSAHVLLGAKSTSGGDQYQGFLDEATVTLT